MNTDIPRRPLGSTGETVSIIGIGGAHLSRPDSDKEGIAIIRTAIDNGITFLDNSCDYHEGRSELRMGKALRDGYRHKAFLMTKFDGHTRTAAEKQIEESFKRLGTDYIDLLQIHEIIRPSDPDEIFAPGGSIETLLALKKAGKVRFIGFTGHKHPDTHLKMLDRAAAFGVKFDTVQMPLNCLDAHYESFEKKVLPVLAERGIGALGMKPMAGGGIFRSGAATARECLRYAMSLPVSTVITGCESMERLEQAIDVARTFLPLTGEERNDILSRTAPYAGNHELYKTETIFDGTFHNPQWLKG